MPSVDETWREFRRYTGDGLPGEPINAARPIGDPQSGPHHPTKREIRDTLRPLEQAIPTVTGLVAEAEAARDAAADYVQAAVSQGNVPIYPSAAAVHALEIPEGITLFRTTGCLTGGDGGGAYYIEVETEPDHPGKTYDINGRWFEITNDPVALGAWTPTTVLTVHIPSEFPDLQTAIAKTSHVSTGGGKIVLMIEAGHALTGGVATIGVDHSHYWVESEDPVVYLDNAFAGVSDVGMLSDDKTDHLFLGYYGRMPVLNCLIDMGHRGDSGYWGCWASHGFVRPGCGVRNAGYHGLGFRGGSCTAHGSIFSGAKQSGFRVAFCANVNAQLANADNCCQDVDDSGPATGALDVSRGGRLFFRQGSCLNSGATGFNVRRGSYINTEQADFSGAAAYGGIVQNGAQISGFSMVINNTRNVSGAGYGLWLRGGYGTIAGATITNSAARYETPERAADVRLGDSSPFASGSVIDASGLVTTDGTNRAWNVVGMDHYNIPNRYGMLNNAALDPPLSIGVFSETGGARGWIWNDNNRLLASVASTSSQDVAVFYNPNGAVGALRIAGSGVSLVSTSDEQLKTNRTPLADEFDLDALFGALEVFGFDWLSALNGEATGERGYGLIAQEVYLHLPHLVTPGSGSPGTPEFVPWRLDLAGFMPFVIARLNQLASRQTALAARVTALETGA